MANNNAPFGCSLIGVGGGVGPNYGLTTFKVSAADTNAIGQGDPLKALDTGYVARWTAGTAASQFVGILQSCQFFSVGEQRVVQRNWWPGSDASGDVTVYAVPVQGATPVEFLIQSSGSAIVAADVFLNGDFSMGTVNTTSGKSAATINQATLATTSTFPMRIMGLYTNAAGAPGADLTTSYNWVRCVANVYQNTGL